MIQKHASATKWRRLLRQQQASGWSVAAFCRQTGIPQASFYFWRKKLRGERPRAGVRRRRTERTPAFVEVRIPGESRVAPKASGVELCLPGGRRVRVRPGFDRCTLLDLLAALESFPPSGVIREGGA
jgi:transposase-like protein